jgi:2-oxoglutarate ferredoxin oxidoreductase subunit alpha
MIKGRKGIDPQPFLEQLHAKCEEMERAEPRFESESAEGAEVLVVAFGTLAKFARFVVREMRDQGLPVGYARPVTLWPFPAADLVAAAQGVRCVAVLEMNAGQMIEDVRLAILGRAPVLSIGGISMDNAGFGVGPLLDPETIRKRIEDVLQSQEHPA